MTSRPHQPNRPQWSPSLADGTTVHLRVGHRQQDGAAMEPVLGGRDDSDIAYLIESRTTAAMEPVLGGRDDRVADNGLRLAKLAAMEPVLGGRDDGSWPLYGDCAGLCRNGARPWRTGRRGKGTRDSWPGEMPQWSPSLADGTTIAAAGAGRGIPVAAMEPVLGGRDDGAAVPDSSESRRCRNGARPWRTGRPATGTGTSAGGMGRNGARPWRTGRPARRSSAWR